VAAEKGYISSEEKTALSDWANNPEQWSLNFDSQP
jgi:hypothetical protein